MIYGDTFGELLEKNRLDKNVLKNKLCRGLCSSVALLRYEQDERIPEKIMADSLLERLGIKPYQFEFVLNDDEFHQIMLRQEIEDFIWKDELKAARNSLKRYKDSIKSCHSIHLQYVLLKEGEIAKKEENLKLAVKDFQEAMQCTKMEEALKESGSGILLTNTETELLFQLAECLYLTGKRQQSNDLFQILKKYMEESFWDNEKRMTYYPHILYRMSEFAYRKCNYGLAEQMLEKAKEEIIGECQIWELCDILALLKEVREKMGKEFSQEDEDFLTVLKIINTSSGGELTKEGFELWQNTVNQQL